MTDRFAASLVSADPLPVSLLRLKPYAPLVGDWDFDWVGHEEDGSSWTVPGEWNFAWILEGRAIQDTWICPRRDLRSSGEYPDGEYGTTIRLWDAKSEAIRVFWFGPILSQISVFDVHADDDGILQEEIMCEGKQSIGRWRFRDILPDSFTWEAFTSVDRGASWRMNQQVFARRRVK